MPSEFEGLRLERLPGVRRRTGLSRTAIYRAIGQGSFPPPVKLSSRASAWNSAEVDRWIAARIVERDSGKRR